ncbi:LOW QUALITY PROTEIN: probable dolichyl pyrophosphate Man9GlcNAc2 alpha-1,3-glucosyltransferase [Drosophila eugracilis]|uniref:LOW QUALITY PROTEIN: probable dolichyl pyrophosphate Man9GlcNAc2 alpha-1,3-glucosyltransferase n=1 Tax=Drosophila eugracilis TaxID=29029 RepID=UPI001BDA24C9|nr:LOW QUALITY PROTEIN: probable dolichyl pyrophosphate Man9GlcNAc2 alpha-1,3-glucosyltransferase [Drosophila eugracilis]
MKSEILATTFLGLAVRSIISLYSYSGYDSPPLHGDYEAQRHWQEVTVNLDVGEWYTNSSNNDLLYWGLDYPPLTAYHSYLVGLIGKSLDSRFVELHESRGFQSKEHKRFMRATVVTADVLIYLPAILYLVYCIDKTFQGDDKLFLFTIIATYPGQILIDNGHFQYNNISLGFAAVAIGAILGRRFYLASFFFTLALNYKQMELYHSLPFFVFLFGECVGQKSFSSFVTQISRIASVVLSTFAILWLPWLGSLQASLQVLHRLFPVARGVFEDKVANVWCAVNVVWKLKKHLLNEQMALVCIGCTLVAALPTNILLFRRRTNVGFLLALFNTALAFFLFSFQVHEKTILLVALPSFFLLKWWPNEMIIFLEVSVFSMLPLLIRDELLVPALVSTFVFHVIFKCFSSNSKQSNEYPLKYLASISNILMIIIVVASLTIPAPSRFPDLWPLVVSVISCGHFLLFFLWGNFQHFTCKIS